MKLSIVSMGRRGSGLEMDITFFGGDVLIVAPLFCLGGWGEQRFGKLL